MSEVYSVSKKPHSERTPLELHLLAALKTIRSIASHNAERHTGFVHIGRIASSWLDNNDPHPSAKDAE